MQLLVHPSPHLQLAGEVPVADSAAKHGATITCIWVDLIVHPKIIKLCTHAHTHTHTHTHKPPKCDPSERLVMSSLSSIRTSTTPD